jgi:hypothetical protein
MSHTYVKFAWSKGNNHEWVIDRDDFINKRYTYYYKGHPIKVIYPPFFSGSNYVCNIVLVETDQTTPANERCYINISEIDGLSEVRDKKLKEIGI